MRIRLATFFGVRGRVWLLPLTLVLLGGCRLDHGLHPVAISGISGRITFVGEWPPNTDWVRVAVYATYPPPSYLAIAGYSDPIPPGVSSYEYELPLKPGRYEWVLVAWKPRESLNIKDIGTYYSHPDSTSKPGVVEVKPGRLTPHIDIVADFSRIEGHYAPTFALPAASFFPR